MEPYELAALLGIDRLPHYLKKLDENLSGTPVPDSLRRPVRQALAGGKRLRPVLVFASARAAGGRVTQSVIDAAASVEMAHCASLLHDDLIDGSGRRRGQTSVGEQEGKPAALLAGDWLLARAAASSRIISDVIAEMAAGQAGQLRREPPYDISARNYVSINGQKTASLFAAACELGARSAGGTAVEALAAYGRAFGQLYQIADDINDGDIAYARRAAARRLAHDWAGRAAEALKPLPPNPAKSGLKAFPGYYLSWALGR